MATNTKSQVRGPRSLLEAVRYFSDPELAFNFVRELRWPDGQPVCPHCQGTDPYFLATRRIWKCRKCRKQFSLKVGTIFEDSPIGWEKWLPAMWLISNSKNSISSHELARALSVTQKTAWFMLHRIREAMEARTFERLTGTVEADETYIGGLARNMHRSRHKTAVKNRGGVWDKMAVAGQVERGGPVQAQVITDTAKRAMHRTIHAHVEEGSTLYTDEWKSYGGLDAHYAHKTVNHSQEYVSGDVHTNTMESFWSLLKRALKGTQIHVSKEHLPRYVTERTFAYNHRLTDDLGRMRMALGGVDGRRVTWKELTYKPRDPRNLWWRS